MSIEKGEGFLVRKGLTCSSPNVVYVVTCKKCRVQGVGECLDARERLPSYIAAASGQLPMRKAGSIHSHFLDSPHSVNDLEIMLVDGLPSNTTRCLQKTLRLRLESRWIARLGAKLNTRRQLHASFSGGMKRGRVALEEV